MLYAPTPQNRQTQSKNLTQEFKNLTHFSPMLHFYTPWKRQKTFDFLMFSGGIEIGHWDKIG